jgi:tRNA(Ile)-lysidine synthase
MDLLERFDQHFKKNFKIIPQHKLLIAVSGGIDSVVLTDLIFRCGYDFIIAHCNFQLRGKESERDEKFVRSLGEKYKKEVAVRKFETERYSQENKISIQEAARNLRYDWFMSFLKTTAGGTCEAIVTAHHADDNIETVLMNFFRGAGLQGLEGIPAFQSLILRPLLIFRKKELIEYARDHKLQFVEDSSNETDKYTRNFFRHQVIPLIKEKYPSVEENILDNIQRFTDATEVYKNAISEIRKKLIVQKGLEVYIPILKLKQQRPLRTIIWELFKDYYINPNQVDEMIKLLDAENSSFIKNEFHTFIKDRKWIIITTNRTDQIADHIVIEPDRKNVHFPNGKMLFEIIPADAGLTGAAHIAQLDADAISYPLSLRKWRQGDYFYPLGMCKKKKLARFFIDSKLSKIEKEKVWVLEMNKKIIWVVGMRIDDRFKVTPKTKKILKIEMRMT